MVTTPTGFVQSMQVLEFNTKVLRPGKSWKKALVLESAGKSLTFERDVVALKVVMMQ